MNARTRAVAAAALVALAVLFSVPSGFAADGRIPVYAPDPAATFFISAPGSYYLTENLAYTGTTVQINASDVTLDLAGHVVSTTSTTASAIYVSDQSNVRITGGKVTGGAHGVRMVKSSVSPGVIRIDNLIVGGQTGRGISLEGASAFPIIPVVEHNLVIGTLNYGIYLSWVSDGRVEHNTVRGVSAAGHSGIYMINTSRCSVSHNIADGNTGHGMSLLSGTNLLVSHNIASNNNVSGIALSGDGNMLVYNNCSSNADSGIALLSAHNTVQYNTLADNSHGLWGSLLASNNSIDWNVAAGNSTCGITLLSSNGNIVSYNRTQNSVNAGSCLNGRSIGTSISSNNLP